MVRRRRDVDSKEMVDWRCNLDENFSMSNEITRFNVANQQKEVVSKS